MRACLHTYREPRNGKLLAIDAWGGAALAARETLAKQTQRESILLPGALGARATPERPRPVGGCPRRATNA